MCEFAEKREKKRFYHNLDLNIIEDNRKFWRYIKLLFCDNHNSSLRNIVIVDEGIIISDNKEVAEKLNKYFIESVDNLAIEPFLPHGHKNTDGDIEEIIRKYSTHLSVLKIKEVSKPKCQSKFNVTVETVRKDISELNTKKASIETDIPTRMMKRFTRTIRS